MPFRLDIRATSVRPLDVWQANAAASSGRRLLTKELRMNNGRKLAVVGGGPLVVDHLAELRAWEGDIWGINQTASWLRSHGIEATLFSIDPMFFEVGDIRSAILATSCDPGVVAAVADVLCFNPIEVHPDGFPGGCSSATRVPSVAMHMGYFDVTFFGCEGSYGDSTHIYKNDGPETVQLIVRAGDRDYKTCSQFMIQCQELAQLISSFPAIYRSQCGGLLDAMIANPDTWEVVAVSAAMKEHLEQVNGKQGLYEKPFPLETAA